MSTPYAACALRIHRRSWGFSQKELADLLGFASRTHVSRIEHGKRIPGLETALACATLFGVSLGELFPQLATEIEEQLRDRALRLHTGLSNTTSTLGLRKRALLTQALQSAIDQLEHHSL